MAESWLPTLDNEGIMAFSDYDWNNVKEAMEEDETEEGEIRQKSTLAKKSGNSSEDNQNAKGLSLDNEEAPRGTQGNMHSLHGEDIGAVGVPRDTEADVLANPTESVQAPINDGLAVVSNNNNKMYHSIGLSKP
ncbi:hypothetical protein Hanom_Chr11g01007301 [Helianthus anomalus]